MVKVFDVENEVPYEVVENLATLSQPIYVYLTDDDLLVVSDKEIAEDDLDQVAADNAPDDEDDDNEQ